MPPPRLLIVSLGNPPPYANTLHSAGHIALNAVAKRLSLPEPSVPSTSIPNLASRAARRSAATTCPSRGWTFYRSASVMNTVGPEVGKIWRAFEAGQRTDGYEPRLVILHDELEAGLGKTSHADKIGGSAKGHNGLKDVLKVLSGVKIARVRIGIGRPESRDPDVVSRWVLSPIKSHQKQAIEENADTVIAQLERIV
ncbi:MAG: aminoacyl-tRNA hydrolase [Vezdaea aestivalis]|nr:MAG: aminoacyl-tRNA hydrolase [Vezdaea aestivalis]